MSNTQKQAIKLFREKIQRDSIDIQCFLEEMDKKTNNVSDESFKKQLESFNDLMKLRLNGLKINDK